MLRALHSFLRPGTVLRTYFLLRARAVKYPRTQEWVFGQGITHSILTHPLKKKHIKTNNNNNNHNNNNYCHGPGMMNRDQESEMRLIKEKCIEENSLEFHQQKSASTLAQSLYAALHTCSRHQ